MKVYESANEAVYDVCQRVMRDGASAEPRGLRTRELLHESFVIRRPWDCVADGISRPKFSHAMLALEATQIVAGRSNPGLFKRIAPESSKFARLVYGERLRAQMPAVEALLRKDPDSRQAVATIWHEGLLTGGHPEDHCTVALQFTIRDGLLNAAALMRSNDAWWGLPYDIAQFCQLQCTLACVLGVDVGVYAHWATSMHLYERHWAAASALTEPGSRSEGLYGFYGDSWSEASALAKHVLDGGDLEEGVHTQSELWFARTLAPYMKEVG